MKQVVALVLTYLFLQGNIGLALVKHYCGDVLALQNINLFVDKPSCGMEKAPKPKSCEKPVQEEPAGCCHNEVQTLQADQSLKAPAMASVEFVPFLLFVITFTFGQFRLTESYRLVTAAGYSPPHHLRHSRFRAFLQIFRH